jgi:transposase
MKNRYLKNARIPERKVRELLTLFCEDLTATQIANISGISRITVNAYLKLIRSQIAEYCEEQFPYPSSPRKNGVSSKMATSNREGSIQVGENHFYGILRFEQSIHTRWINTVDNQWMNNWLKGKIKVETETLDKLGVSRFEAIADFSRTKLYRVNSVSETLRVKPKIDEIDLFWGRLKSRIAKFRGLNCNTTFLHIKESEFRYNHRNEDLFALIHSLIQKRPLHYLKQETAL